MGVVKWDNSARHRTEDHERNVALTPPWLVARVRDDLFGGAIDLDPATTRENPTGAARFICLPDDGILSPWNARRIYCNPPYGSTLPKWVEKSIIAEAGGSQVVLLVPARTETRWFQRALHASTDCLLFSRRLQFDKDVAVRRGINAPFPSALFGFGVELAPLADLGTIVKPQRASVA